MPIARLEECTNPRLYNGGLTRIMTSAEQEVYRKILSDVTWRISNLYMVRDPWGKLVPFRPNAGQLWYLRNRHYWNLIAKARRLGFSTIIDIIGLDRAIFNSNQSIGLIDLTITDAKKKLAVMAEAYRTMGLGVEGLEEQERHELNAFLLKEFPTTCAPDKIPAETISWENGSRFTCSTTFRGGALQYLHVSEFGPIALHRPMDARKILTGALPAVASGNMVNFESTHKGGKGGEHYELIREALARQGKAHNPREFKMLFFPFYQDPKNVIPANQVALRPEEEKIFEAWQAKGIKLSPDQKAFWANEYRTLKHDTFREWPACIEDMFRAPVEGSIYGERLAEAEAEGRVGHFGVEPHWPCLVAWDLGFSDSTAMWLIQATRLDYRILDFYQGSGNPVSHYINKVQEWSRWAPIRQNLLPHDAEQNSRSGRTFLGDAREAGLQDCQVVPQTRNIWMGINEARELMKNCVWHARTEKGRELLGQYRKRIYEDGQSMNPTPVHDHTSHAADAFRTFAEARILGLISPYMGAVSFEHGAVEVIGV